MSFDGLLDIILPTPSSSVTLVFGRIDAAGKVFLEPGNVPIVPSPPSLVPLTSSSRFVGTMQGVDGKPQSLLIIGIIGGDGNRPGVILQYAGVAAPEGYLLCQGQAVSRTMYARLYAVVGTIYGAGDGSTTFNLPDYRGRGPMGLSTSQSQFAPLGQRGGESSHTMTWDEMPRHSHTVAGRLVGRASGGDIFRELTHFGSGLDDDSTESWDAGDDQPFNVLDPYLVTNFIIRT